MSLNASYFYSSQPSIYFTLNSTGVILSVSQKGATFLKQPMQRLLGQTVVELFHKADRFKFQTLLNHRLTYPDIEVNGKFRLLDRDGGEHLVQVGFEALQGGDGAATILLTCRDTDRRPPAEFSWEDFLSRDVMKRRHAEQALQESETHLRLALGAAQMGTWDWDIVTNEVTYSDQLGPVFGLPAGTYHPDQAAFLNTVHPDDRTLVAQAIAHSIQNGVDYGLEFRIFWPDGTLHWVENRGQVLRNADGKPVRMIGVARDITSRKHSEDALRDSEQTFRQLAENIRDVFFLASLAEQIQLIYVSPAYEEMWGRSRESLYAHPDSWLEGVHPDDRPRLQAFTQRIRHSTPSRPSEEYRIIRPDGSMRWSLTRLFPIYDESGQIYRVAGIAEDITERKQIEDAIQQQAEREHLMRVVIQTIRNSLDLTTIFSTAAREIAHLLQADRAEIFQYLPIRKVWLNVADYRQNPQLPTALGVEVSDENNPLAAQVKQLQVVQVADSRSLMDSANRGLDALFPGAWLVVPLQIGSVVWGCLALVRTRQPSVWQDVEREICCGVADQLAIAIQQSQLYSQVRRLNSNLERQVQARTAQLQLAFEFEATLKRITDKVRDSLDEDQIMQTAVEELAIAIGVSRCNAALYDLKQRTSSIRYEYITHSDLPHWYQTVSMADFPEGYDQLLRGQQFQFCPLTPDADGEPIAVLACPIADNQDVLGDLWLIKQNYHCFNEQDLRLSQQVANYCAIALRQSRLYQASQAQVTELEKLNQLKDDFLSTVSHELRTPMANIKMATQMLTVLVNDARDSAGHASEQPAALTLSTASFQKVDRYLQILQHECQREIRLINDLLDLSRLNAGTIPLTLSNLDLRQFLSRIAEPFLARASEHHQQLQLDLPDHLPLLISEETSLERIVIELLNNACKYTPPNETIVVRARFQNGECNLFTPDDSQSGRYPLTRSHPEDAIAPHFQISVLNSGVHIPPDELAHIFDKFYRIPNNDPWKHGGTGLGLALAQKLTEHLDGSLQVFSQPDQICFTIKLPAR